MRSLSTAARHWPRSSLIRVALLLAAGAAAACAPGGSHQRRTYGDTPDTEVTDVPDAEHFEVLPPPFSDGIFPCSECHASSAEQAESEGLLVPDPTRRKLTLLHEDIVLHHDERHRWCLDCHDTWNRDKLHLASGELVEFTESYRLCGQCHGDRYRDWRAGVHGRRTGEWAADGKKKYLLCVSCHNSHSPRFRPLEPLPAPIPPGGKP